MAVFLGIDIGTSGTKTLAMNQDGSILATSTVEYPLYSPKPGWSEQEPAGLVDRVRQRCPQSHEGCETQSLLTLAELD